MHQGCNAVFYGHLDSANETAAQEEHRPHRGRGERSTALPWISRHLLRRRRPPDTLFHGSVHLEFAGRRHHPDDIQWRGRILRGDVCDEGGAPRDSHYRDRNRQRATRRYCGQLQPARKDTSPKMQRPHEFKQAIRVVHSGSVWAPRRVLCTFIERATASPRRVLPQGGEDKISEREREVLKLLVAGRSNREIGGVLGIEERTVKAHVSQLMRKVGVKNRIALSVHAVTHSLLSLRP